jgi:hypothetical protein
MADVDSVGHTGFCAVAAAILFHCPNKEYFRSAGRRRNFFKEFYDGQTAIY